MDFSNKLVAVVGLGYVGLPLAVEFAKFRNVIGFDIDHHRVAELRTGNDHTLECSPQELSTAKLLSYSADPAELRNAQISLLWYPRR